MVRGIPKFAEDRIERADGEEQEHQRLRQRIDDPLPPRLGWAARELVRAVASQPSRGFSIGQSTRRVCPHHGNGDIDGDCVPGS
jgi:hypothetical protein